MVYHGTCPITIKATWNLRGIPSVPCLKSCTQRGPWSYREHIRIGESLPRSFDACHWLNAFVSIIVLAVKLPKDGRVTNLIDVCTCNVFIERKLSTVQRSKIFIPTKNIFDWSKTIFFRKIWIRIQAWESRRAKKYIIFREILSSMSCFAIIYPFIPRM